MINIKEAYVDKAICHRYSKDPTRQLISNHGVNLMELDQKSLVDSFLKPFSTQRREYVFSNNIDIKYNVLYQICLDLIKGTDFVNTSINIFKHLVNVSTSPNIKNGDVLIIKFDDITVGNKYCNALGIYKIENLKTFYETEINEGNISLSLQKGFGNSKLDKAALIVFEDKIPIVYLIDSGKDSQYWQQDFLSVVPKANNYSNTEDLSNLCIEYIFQATTNGTKTKSEGVTQINTCNEYLSSHKDINVKDFSKEIFGKESSDFLEYSKALLKQRGCTLNDSFTIEKKGIKRGKSFRTIKLDDTVELTILRTGGFIERGYDENRKEYYYKFYFREER